MKRNNILKPDHGGRIRTVAPNPSSVFHPFRLSFPHCQCYFRTLLRKLGGGPSCVQDSETGVRTLFVKAKVSRAF